MHGISTTTNVLLLQLGLLACADPGAMGTAWLGSLSSCSLKLGLLCPHGCCTPSSRPQGATGPPPPLSGVTQGSQVLVLPCGGVGMVFFLRERMTKGGNKIQRKTGRRTQYQRQRARNPEGEQPKSLFPQQLALTLLTLPGRRLPGCHRKRTRVCRGGCDFVSSSFAF